MISSDSKLAKLFYSYGSSAATQNFSKVGSNMTSKEMPRDASLTLENLKLHEKITQDANNKFLPKINRLVQQVANRPTTQFSGQFSIFEALYELENFGKMEEETKSTAAQTDERTTSMQAT